MKYKRSKIEKTVSGLADWIKKLEDNITPNPFQMVKVIPKTEEDFGHPLVSSPSEKERVSNLSWFWNEFYKGDKQDSSWYKIEFCDYYCPAPVSNPIRNPKLRRDLIRIFEERERIKPAFGRSAPVEGTEHFRCDRPERERIHFKRPYADSIILEEYLSIQNYHRKENGGLGCNCPIELRYVVSSDPEELLRLKADGIDKMVGEESRCYWYLINPRLIYKRDILLMRLIKKNVKESVKLEE